MAHDTCCKRLNSQLMGAKGELRRLARLEAYHAQRGHRTIKLRAQIARAKSDIAMLERNIESHEADHAGVAVLDTTSASDREQMAAHRIQVGSRA